MAEKTEIAWTDSTFNPWIGCTKVGPGCDHCYAEREFDHRHHRAKWGAGQERVRTSLHNWNLPMRWNRNACWFIQCNDCGWRGEATGAVCQHCHSTDIETARRRVFCASLADVFDNEVPGQWRDDLWTLVGLTQNIDWLILTKRIGNAARMLPWMPEYSGPDGQRTRNTWRNVWLGATIVNQAEADRDIPKLLAVPAAGRFLSIEPMLGPVDIERFIRNSPTDGHYNCSGRYVMPRSVDWVIVGGESGPKARPIHPDWVRSVRDQCAAAGVPFLFKQWGSARADLAGSRLLDGKLHDAFYQASRGD